MNNNELSEEKRELLLTMLNCDPDGFVKKYKKYKKAEEEFKKMYEPFKKSLIDLYKKDPELAKSIIIDDVQLTYVAPSIRDGIDTKKLQEELPDIYKKYTKTTEISASIRLTSCK